MKILFVSFFRQEVLKQQFTIYEFDEVLRGFERVLL